MSKPTKRKCPACGEEKEFRADQKTCGCKGSNPELYRIKPPARVIFLDIETAPSVGWVWGKWEQNVLDFKEDGYTLSFCTKVLGEKGVLTKALPDYPNYDKDKKDDRNIIAELWEILNQADIVIAHNGDKFDLPWINARFVSLGFHPPSPYQIFDTLKVARKKFEFKSNKLDDLCRDLGIGRKIPHTGFNLWKACMDGDLKAWRQMKRYNKRDILLLEELYYRFRPWANTHPNVNKGQQNCIRCGSDKIKQDGFRFTALRKKGKMHCLDCGGWFETSAQKVEEIHAR